MAYRICDVKSPDADTLGLMSRILSDGRSSRLYKTLVHERRLAQSVSVFSAPAEHQGLFFVSLIAAQGVSLDVLEKAFDEELQKIIVGDVAAAELEKVKNANDVALLRGFSTVMGVADNLAYFHTFLGNAGEINNEPDKAARVTLDEIQRVAKQYFTSGRVVLHWLPK
jgi:zinc protease